MKNEIEKNQQNEMMPVSVFVDENGKKWVRIRTLDLDFKIELHDYREGDKARFTWHELMERAKEGKIRMIDKKKAKAIYLYIDEVNAALKEAGGEELKGWYWTETESQYNSTYAWIFCGTTACVTDNRDFAYGCRFLACE